jgi:uncharacterized protein (DUF1697 family)
MSAGNRYVAFLRAINVGGRVVKMDRLRALFETLRLSNVETMIASGNVLFDAPAAQSPTALEQRIEQHLRKTLGYDVATFLRTPDEIATIVAHEPFAPDASAHAIYVAFLKAPPSTDARRTLLGFSNDVDQFTSSGREVYWKSRKSIGESTFSGAQLEKTLGMPATMRNITTVRKLGAKCAPAR